jgi:hypothetical protein
LPSVVWH